MPRSASRAPSPSRGIHAARTTALQPLSSTELPPKWKTYPNRPVTRSRPGGGDRQSLVTTGVTPISRPGQVRATRCQTRQNTPPATRNARRSAHHSPHPRFNMAQNGANQRGSRPQPLAALGRVRGWCAPARPTSDASPESSAHHRKAFLRNEPKQPKTGLNRYPERTYQGTSRRLVGRHLSPHRLRRYRHPP